MASFQEILSQYRTNGEAYLRNQVPEVKRVESLDMLEDLRLLNITDAGVVLMLEYEARAPKLFPYVRKNLIESGVVKRHNFLNAGRRNIGTQDEFCGVRMGFYGISLQIYLKVRKF